MANFDLVILSNGPGEITTWVLPVVKQLRSHPDLIAENLRISLVLSPCPHATGNEVNIARQMLEIDRTQGADNFWSFLLWGQSKDNWDWYERGLVLFLGGDQFFTLVTAKRLGYHSLVYAEWDARWYRYIDYFAVMNQAVIDKIPAYFHDKFTVVGDLMADIQLDKDRENNNINNQIKIGLLPGSKASKLTQGVPFLMAIAEYINRKNPDIEFIIPIAPTINTEILASYANKKNNSLISIFNDVTGELIEEEKEFYLQTSGGVKIKLITEFPCYEQLQKCHICLTTVGANTAQLGALAIPMLILLPTYQLTAMKSWDGLLGMLANLPLIGDRFATLINKIVFQYTIKNNKLYGWPNIWAKREIVPELIGNLKIEEVGDLTLELLENKEKLAQMKQDLKTVRGESGASIKIAEMINTIVNINSK
jgi:lipid-A-disaccharide synthase